MTMETDDSLRINVERCDAVLDAFSSVTKLDPQEYKLSGIVTAVKIFDLLEGLDEADTKRTLILLVEHTLPVSPSCIERTCDLINALHSAWGIPILFNTPSEGNKVGASTPSLEKAMLKLGKRNIPYTVIDWRENEIPTAITGGFGFFLTSVSRLAYIAHRAGLIEGNITKEDFAVKVMTREGVEVYMQSSQNKAEGNPFYFPRIGICPSPALQTYAAPYNKNVLTLTARFLTSPNTKHIVDAFRLAVSNSATDALSDMELLVAAREGKKFIGESNNPNFVYYLGYNTKQAD